MADHEVDRSHHGTLGADAVDAVTLTRDWARAEVKNRGEEDIYFTVNGDTPSAGADNTYVVPAGESVVVPLPTKANVPDVVKLIADDSCAYSVAGVSDSYQRSGGGGAAAEGGGGGAVTVANGADVAQGSTTDAEATGNGSVAAILKRLRTLLNGGLPAALGAGGGVKIDGSGTAVPVSGTVTASDGGGSLTVDGTVAVTDGGGSLTVDGTVAVTGVATEATLDARTGALTETAPATDTASAGLNGRLQRVAQRLSSIIALLPTALGAGGGIKVDGSGTALPVSGTVGVTGVATESTLDARTGSLTETAPASDTASSGINGRLQRIAQRITSAITLLGGGLPAALAAGGGLKVEGVASGVAVPISLASFTAPVSGELQGVTSATVLPTVTSKLVMFSAQYDNVGKVYIGVAGVTKADGTTDTTTGFQLGAGQSTPWIPVDNLNRLYRICDNTGDDLTYLVMN